MTAASVVCIANISPRERGKRLGIGAISLLIALVILAVLMMSGVDRWWRLGLLPFFFLASSGFFQWREKTCVGLAKRGVRKMGDETEQIEDGAELAQVRRQARQVQIKSLSAALVCTIVALLIP